MIWRIALLAIMIALIPSVPAAAGADDGVIQGQVINQTEDGSSTADTAISLMISIDSAEVDSATVQTDAEGRFEFDGLSTESGYGYQMTLTFQEIEYSSAAISFNPGETSRSIDIQVYDSTDSDENILIADSYTVIYTERSILGVSEYYQFYNHGDTYYIGTTEVTDNGDKEILRFTLPAGATDLQYLTGLVEGNVIDTEDGFIDIMPLPPGEKEVAYSYNLVPNSGTYNFSQKFHYPVYNYTLAVQDVGSVEASSDQLALGEPLSIGDAPYINLSRTGLPADTLVTASLSGLPVAGSQTAVIWTTIGLAVAAGGFGAGYLLKKKKFRRSGMMQVDISNTTEDERQKLFLEIARLDDEFEAGKVSKEQYDMLRSEKKMRLVELMRRPKVKNDGA